MYGRILILFLFLCFSAPQSALAQERDKTIYVHVSASDDMLFRAENIHEDSNTKTSGSMSNSKGFAADGNYGTKDIEELVATLRKKAVKRLKKTDWIVVTDTKADPVYVLQIMIMDARNNTPTMNQIRASNISSGQKLGGATLVGKLTLISDASKSKTYVYADYSERTNAMTWGSAHQAFSYFTKNLAKAISDDSLVLDEERVSF